MKSTPKLKKKLNKTYKYGTVKRVNLHGCTLLADKTRTATLNTFSSFFLINNIKYNIHSQNYKKIYKKKTKTFITNIIKRG